MKTYQDYLKAVENNGITQFVGKVIEEHKQSKPYKTALIADEYDAERNTTINDFVKVLFAADGTKLKDETASNLKLTSNFFNILNTQRCSYSLGNGVSFQKKGIKEKLGKKADDDIYEAAYYALIHGVSFLYWAYDHIHTFKLTEFAPLIDETTSGLGAGVRFWQLDEKKPLNAFLYTPDGYIEYTSETGTISELKPKTNDFVPYRTTVQTTPAVGGDVVTAHNYAGLPIIPMYGSRLHQSTLIGMRSKIDAFDSVQSGFANDMTDCAQIYWIVSGAGGMTEKDLSKFRERLLYRHIASAPNADEAKVEPYTQEIPFTAREALLSRLKSQIYYDFGIVDTSNISASSKTATEINAAYQAMDDKAADFEKNVSAAIRDLLVLQGVSEEDADPQFIRKKIANELEQVQMVMLEAQYLDEETVLNKLPNIMPEEVEKILKKKAEDDLSRFNNNEPDEPPGGEE